MKINWTTEIKSGTALRGYYDSPWSFEETVARLITASGQPAQSFDQYKTSVEFTGYLDGKVFTLYDYKEDREIHIGGENGLNVYLLQELLTAELRKVEPTPYSVKEYYDQMEGHSYPVTKTRNGYGR